MGNWNCKLEFGNFLSHENVSHFLQLIKMSLFTICLNWFTYLTDTNTHLNFGGARVQPHEDLSLQEAGGLRVLHLQRLHNQVGNVHLPISAKQEVLLIGCLVLC